MGLMTMAGTTVEFRAEGLYEHPLEDDEFSIKVEEKRTVLTLHNKLLSEFDSVEVTFIIKDFWGNEFFLELEKSVGHNDNDDLIEFDRDFTQAILKNSKLTSIWLKLEFNKPTLYIFLRKMHNNVYARGVVF